MTADKTIRGFTMIEMLAVMAIIAILVGIAVPAYMAVQKSSMKQQVMADLQNMKAGLAKLKTDFGAWPPESDSPLGVYLKSLPEADVYRNGRLVHRGGAPYSELEPRRMVNAGTFTFGTDVAVGLWAQLNASSDTSDNLVVTRYEFRDPYGKAYRYVVDGNGYRLYSFGPDGQDDSGGDDDISVTAGQ